MCPVQNQNFELTIEEQQYRLAELAASTSRLEEAVAARTAEATLSQQNLALSEQNLEVRLRRAASEEQEAKAQAQLQADLLEKSRVEATLAVQKLEEDASILRERESAADAARRQEQEDRMRTQKQKKALEDHLHVLEQQMVEQEEQVAQAMSRADEQSLIANEQKQRAQEEHNRVACLQLQLTEMEDKLQRATPDVPLIGTAAGTPPGQRHHHQGGSLADDIAPYEVRNITL